jgi:deoxyribonuclease IV
MKHKPRLLIGAHISIAGGFDQAVARAESIHCTALQIFTKSNRQWNSASIPEHEIDTFKNALQRSSIKKVIAHASYLINIGSPHVDVHKKSVNALKDELLRCTLLGIPYLVLHPGSSLTMPLDACLKLIAKSIDSVLQETPSDTMILLETMAGQGSTVCYTFEQLATLYNLCSRRNRIGICLDTCHIFAAGYDLRNSDTYQRTWEQFDSLVGLGNLHAIHVNDSKKELGSRVDRHEHIGKGKIGLEGFKLLLNDERLFDIPKILETPKSTLADDSQNLDLLRSMLTASTKTKLAITHT